MGNWDRLELVLGQAIDDNRASGLVFWMNFVSFHIFILFSHSWLLFWLGCCGQSVVQNNMIGEPHNQSNCQKLVSITLTPSIDSHGFKSNENSVKTKKRITNGGLLFVPEWPTRSRVAVSGGKVDSTQDGSSSRFVVVVSVSPPRSGWNTHVSPVVSSGVASASATSRANELSHCIRSSLAWNAPSLHEVYHHVPQSRRMSRHGTCAVVLEVAQHNLPSRNTEYCRASGSSEQWR